MTQNIDDKKADNQTFFADVEEPVMPNALDVKAPELSLNELINTFETPDVDAQEINLALSEAQIKQMTQRRDYLMYLVLQKVDVTKQNVLESIAAKFLCTIEEVIADIRALANSDIWKHHKQRLKSMLWQKQQRCAQLAVARKNEVSDKMERSFTFTAENLLSLAKQFECRPLNIAEDIQHFKKFTTQKQLFIERKSKAPAIRAFGRFAKYNLKY